MDCRMYIVLSIQICIGKEYASTQCDVILLSVQRFGDAAAGLPNWASPGRCLFLRQRWRVENGTILAFIMYVVRCTLSCGDAGVDVDC